jgi:hypothetical protein
MPSEQDNFAFLKEATEIANAITRRGDAVQVQAALALACFAVTPVGDDADARYQLGITDGKIRA